MILEHYQTRTPKTMFDFFKSKTTETVARSQTIPEAIAEAKAKRKFMQDKGAGLIPVSEEELARVKAVIVEAMAGLPAVIVKNYPTSKYDYVLLQTKGAHLKVCGPKDPLFLEAQRQLEAYGLKCECNDYMSSDFLVAVWIT